MTFDYMGRQYKLTFIHDQRLHPRLGERREATTLRVSTDNPGRFIEQTFFSNPEKPLQSKEFRRSAVIGKFKPFLPRQEYVALRRAYFLRPRKTAAARAQTRAFHKELKKIMADADRDASIKSAADLMLRMEGIKDGAAKELHV